MASIKKTNIGIILIAGGNSSRLGHMKQLIKINNKTFLKNSFEIAQQLSSFAIAILGYNQEKLITQVNENKSLVDNFIFNEDWPIGMGTSIALGVEYFSDPTIFKDETKIDAIMIMQCDQYRLTFEDYSNLIEVWRNSDKGIVASQYLEICSDEDQDINSNKSTIGAPAIFSKFYYDELLLLKEKGAKALLIKYSKDLEVVKLDDAAFDLDSEKDLDAFNNYLDEL